MDEEIVRKVMSEMGRKGARRRLETTTPEQRAEWGRKGGKLAGRGRPKSAKAKAKRKGNQEGK